MRFSSNVKQFVLLIIVGIFLLLGYVFFYILCNYYACAMCVCKWCYFGTAKSVLNKLKLN